MLLQDTMKEKELKREYLKKLFIFIDHILRLPQEAEGKLIQELKSIMEEEGAYMGLSLEDTSFAKFFREEGEKQKAIKIATRLL